jgi:hypothetical protein
MALAFGCHTVLLSREVSINAPKHPWKLLLKLAVNRIECDTVLVSIGVEKIEVAAVNSLSPFVGTLLKSARIMCFWKHADFTRSPACVS